MSRPAIALLSALLVLAVAPAIASAAPPDNDDYWFSTRINQPGDLLQDDFQDLTTNTDEATEQADLFDPGGGGGGGPEVTQCNFASGREVYYGKTVWWDFFPDVDGVVRIQANGFDTVIGLVPYDFDTAEPFRDEWTCADDPALTTGETEDFDVEAGRSYSIQIGGYGGEDGTHIPFKSGDLEFTFKFFPDTDGDGVLDQSDDCLTAPGLAKFAGCPDADDDGVPEPPDACPGVKGSLANGCNPPPPRPDADHDNVFDDGPDQCVGEDASARDANRNGCLDLRRLEPKWIFKPDSFFVRRSGRVVLLGIEIERFGVTNVPKGARVVVTCTRRACRRMSKRANSRVLFRQLAGDKLRAGIKVIIRVTAPGYVGAARVYTIKRNDYATKSRCLMPGSPRLRTGCSPVR
jgi:hypothetical protein